MESPGIDGRKIPYQLPQPTGIVADIFTSGALNLDGDEQEWVFQSPDVDFKPLVLNVTEGYYVNLLRVRRSGVLSRHRHSGPVHALTLRGEWHYLEHDWLATTGDYVFEPPGETHTLVVPDHVMEMITLFHVTAGYVYVDPTGTPLGYEDVFTKLANARAHYQRVGLGAEFANRVVR
jgi:2,4'-dihydroxyacetophenone dioxygenase